MKRLFVVMIAAIAAGLLAGCYFPDDVPDKEQGNSSAYGEKDVYGLNETAVFKTLKFTATDVKSSWLSKSTAKFRITPEMVSERENVDSGTVDGIHGLNDTVSVKGLDFTASEFRESKGGKYSEAAEGKIFVGVKFTIENKSDSEKSISSILLFDGYADGVKCDYAYGAGDEFDGQLDGNLAPGRRMIGWYVVEVPENWQEIDLVVRSEWLSKNTVTFRITR